MLKRPPAPSSRGSLAAEAPVPTSSRVSSAARSASVGRARPSPPPSAGSTSSSRTSPSLSRPSPSSSTSSASSLPARPRIGRSSSSGGGSGTGGAAPPAPAPAPEEPVRRGFTNKPSAKIDSHKATDPFATKKKHKTNFGYIYSKGGIPCRINHGCNFLKLQWDREPFELDYNPLLIHCMEGLTETDHPYCFVAKQAAKELLEADGASRKVSPLLSAMIPHIRNALMVGDREAIDSTLDIIVRLSSCLGEELNSHLHVFLPQLNKKCFDRAFKDKIFDVLQKLEEYGAPGALPIIKSKVPTYQPLFG